jgi:hypothetical protein
MNRSIATLRIIQLSILSLFLVSFSSIEVYAQFWKKDGKDAAKEKEKPDSDKKAPVEPPKKTSPEDQEAKAAASVAAGTTCCGFGLVTTFLLGVVCFLFYFLPTFVGFFRKHPNMTPILIVNIFLGWTLVGYVVALAWAFTAQEEPKTYRRKRYRDEDDDE